MADEKNIIYKMPGAWPTQDDINKAREGTEPEKAVTKEVTKVERNEKTGKEEQTNDVKQAIDKLKADNIGFKRMWVNQLGDLLKKDKNMVVAELGKLSQAEKDNIIYTMAITYSRGIAHGKDTDFNKLENNINEILKVMLKCNAERSTTSFILTFLFSF